MEVTGVDSTVSTTATETLTNATSLLGKDAFLKLLTVQLQNQDPMSPLENNELVAQLAQFSSLEQLENIADSLQNNLDLNLLLTQVLNNTAAAGLIGKEVVASGDEVALTEDGTADLTFDLEDDAATVKVSIMDETGTVIKTLGAEDLGAGRNVLTWDGTNEAGREVAEGTYTFKVEATNADGEAVTASTLVVGEVLGVRYEDGQAMLLIGGREVGIGDVIEIADKSTT
jgi:flagellar basal-body rod modification protein FlgD